MTRPVLLFFLLMILSFKGAVAQNANEIANLSVNVVTTTADTSKPFIIYITGDGGWNKFSKSLAGALAGKGYPVVALDAHTYFWDKKTPEQTAKDISKLISYYQRSWKRKNVLLIGYSFGADVTPFVYNLLSKELASAVVNISLLSPSNKTDFEIHIWGMMGGSSGGESVTAAINKIKDKALTLIFGKDEDDFSMKELTIKNYTNIKLAGGHHYDGDEEAVCNTILAQALKNSTKP